MTTDAENDIREAELDKKKLSRVKVKAGIEEYQFKINDLERSIRRVGREKVTSEAALVKVEAEIKTLEEELKNG